MKIETAKELLEAIKTYREASDGDSGDAENDAGLDLVNQVKAMLVEESGRDIALADLIDEFEAEEAETAEYSFIDDEFIAEVSNELGAMKQGWSHDSSSADICKAVLRVSDRLDPARRGVKFLQDKISRWPADWDIDSNLTTWFPLTAEEMKRDKGELARLRRESGYP